jgi:hypothetical protein
MAKELLPDASWLRIAPLIPPEAPKPKGGRPRVSERDPVRAEDRYSLGVLACRDGLWERDDMLAEAAGLVQSRRLASLAPSAARRAGPRRSHQLGPGRLGLRRGTGSVGAKKRARTQRIEANRARSAILWSTPKA